MGSQEAVTVAHAACPCGNGQVRIIVTYEDTDWGSRDHDWHGVVACERCKPLYTFVGAGRGADVVRVEDKELCDRLRDEAKAIRRRFLASAEVEEVLEKVAAAFDALPSVAARYRLAVQLKLETATLSTFRKHTRNRDTRRWLASLRHMSHLAALFEFAGGDPASVSAAEAQAGTLEAQAFDALRPAMSLGPISLFASPREGR